jgi:hypothetical protein
LAGYDIESLTVVGGMPSPRFIEVKAVPAESFRFFWSREERNTAHLLGRSYFLYLVPVYALRRIDISGLRIVEDAYTNVYENGTEWNIESDVVLCQPKHVRYPD